MLFITCIFYRTSVSSVTSNKEVTQTVHCRKKMTQFSIFMMDSKACADECHCLLILLQNLCTH